MFFSENRIKAGKSQRISQGVVVDALELVRCLELTGFAIFGGVLMLQPTRKAVLSDRQRIMNELFSGVDVILNEVLASDQAVSLKELVVIHAHICQIETYWKQHEKAVEPTLQDCLWRQLQEEVRLFQAVI